MGTISKINRTAEKAILPIVAGLLLFITLLLTANVIGRYALGYSLKWAEECTNYIIIWITFLAGVNCLRKGMQISMDALILQFNDAMQAVVKRITNSIGLVFSLIMVWLGFKLTVMALSTGQVSPAMMVPMYIPYSVLPLSGVFMALEYLEFIILGEPKDIPLNTEEL
jgi:TRAP-type C4-dicarboxylate transport system permease small subunit